MVAQPEMSRRSALLTGAAALPLVAALPAFADTATEEAMARIAAKNAAKQAKEKEAERIRLQAALEKQQNGGGEVLENTLAPLLIAGVSVGGFLLVLPFFYKNLMRIYLKFTAVGKELMGPKD